MVLQHPQEEDLLLGSAVLAALSLPRCTVSVGLSWASLSAALGRKARQQEWAVLYPSSLPRKLSLAEQKVPALVLNRTGDIQATSDIRGLIVLDGTWSQAKTLWWRNPWLVRLSRLCIHPREPSIYGRLRPEPRPGYVSTLEAIADGLVAMGEPEATRTALRRLFRTMVQRARDYV